MKKTRGRYVLPGFMLVGGAGGSGTGGDLPQFIMTVNEDYDQLNVSSANGGEINWGDGTINTFASGVQTPTHTYTDPGTYTVSITFTGVGAATVTIDPTDVSSVLAILRVASPITEVSTDSVTTAIVSANLSSNTDLTLIAIASTALATITNLSPCVNVTQLGFTNGTFTSLDLSFAAVLENLTIGNTQAYGLPSGPPLDPFPDPPPSTALTDLEIGRLAMSSAEIETWATYCDGLGLSNNGYSILTYPTVALTTPTINAINSMRTRGNSVAINQPFEPVYSASSNGTIYLMHSDLDGNTMFEDAQGFVWNPQIDDLRVRTLQVKGDTYLIAGESDASDNVYYTTDGSTWNPVAGVPNNKFIYGAVGISNVHWVLVTQDGDIYESADVTTTDFTLQATLTDFECFYSENCIAHDYDDTNRICVVGGVESTQAASAYWALASDVTSWTASTGLPTDPLTELIGIGYNPANDVFIVAETQSLSALYVSSNGGSSFSAVTPDNYPHKIMYSTEINMWLGADITNKQILVADQADLTTWTSVFDSTTDYANTEIYSFVDPLSGSLFAYANFVTGWRASSNNDGSAWQPQGWQL